MKLSANTPPTAIVIFGGTGDLAKTKLFPALLDLYVAGQLPEKFVVIGLSRKELSDTAYQTFVHDSIKRRGQQHSDGVVQAFCEHVRYVAGSFDDPAAYERIKSALNYFDDSIGQCTNKLYYLAVPPQYYEVIFEYLAASQAMALCDNRDSWARLLVEKPFGRDLSTAQALEKKLCALFTDEQIYRIDHYLAKDAIENIMAIRSGNTLFAQAWHGAAIESIEIKLLETKDVSNRGAFYDEIGTLRDVGQNHMLQILALLTMESVDVHDAVAIRAARAAALQKLDASNIDKVVRGQYAGYSATHGVADGSDTETYFEVTWILHEVPWQGTRVRLVAGKALDRHSNEVTVTFRPASLCLCGAAAKPHEHRNVLHMQFAPEQRMSVSVWTKTPGSDFALREQALTLLQIPGEESASPEAYERVLLDCIQGDQTRFVSGAEVEAAWRFITPILERFLHEPLAVYQSGTRGPVGS